MDKFNNGLHSFSFHGSANDSDALRSINSSFRQRNSRLATGTATRPEDAARFYLDKTFESEEVPLASFNKPEVAAESKIDFEAFKVEDIPFTENKTVKFRQKVNNISVYGSCVNVEMDKDYNLVSVNSSIAPLIAVNTLAKISAADALKTAETYIENTIPVSVTPLLYIYFFQYEWKLVYVLKDVFSKKKYTDSEGNQTSGELPGFLNYINVIVDAQTGEVLKESPRATGLQIEATGDDDIEYTISVRENNNVLELADEQLNVITYDLNFESFNIEGNLPGTIITKNGNSWLAPGVNAHHNACMVAKFLKDVLRRNGIDNNGMTLTSTVRCRESLGINWMNAAWLRGIKQMVYGQTNTEGIFKTLARSLDIVAHEIMHGVTEFTSCLDYENQTGALNESYSDIFAIIISNNGNPDPGTWNWQFGDAISEIPLRDLSFPERFEQPSHMDDYRNLPNNRINDWGGVHTNSGIHNKAAFNLITSVNTGGSFVFSGDEPAILLYMGLIQLSNISGFSDSYRSILNAADSLFRSHPEKVQKINAIQQAFENVGIENI